MLYVTRTGLGISVQTAKYIGSAHDVLPNTTMGQALYDPLIVPFQPTPATKGMEVIDTYDPQTDTDALRLKYMVIGNKGHRNINGPGVPTTTPIPHASTDTGLFGMIPFVVRPVTTDLTPQQREKYRLRKTMEINGDLYAAYYARVIDVTGLVPTLSLTVIVSSTPVTTAFSPTINNLRPPVPAIGVGNDGSYLDVSSPVTIDFTVEEVTWLKDACQLLYGDSNFAIISEIGFCTGVEKEVTEVFPASGTQTPSAVTPGTYYDITGVQINMFASVYYPVASTNAGFEYGYELGATEPLFGEQIN